MRVASQGVAGWTRGVAWLRQGRLPPFAGQTAASPPSERPLQVCMAGLGVLGAWLWGLSQGNLFLPILATAVGVSSLVLCDFWGWLRLNSLAANVAAAAACVWWWQSESHDPLYGMAQLLLLLQFIVQFRRKTVRHYWLLSLVSLLVVAVAAVVNASFGFALLLLAYVFVGLLALVVFFLYREQVRFADPTTDPTTSSPGAGARPPSPTLAPPPNYDAARKPFAVDPPAAESSTPARRWPLADLGASLTPDRTASPPPEPVGRLLRLVLRLSVGTLFLAAVVFLLLPRGGATPWHGGGLKGGTRTVGFAARVKLGELGQVLQNDDEVLRIELKSLDHDLPYSLNEPLLLRGTLLTAYQDAEWQVSIEADMVPMPVSPPLIVPLGHDVVRQVVTVEPLNVSLLFCLAPSIQTHQNPYLLWAPEVEQLARVDTQRDKPYSYQLDTVALQSHGLAPVVPCVRELDFFAKTLLLDLPPANARRPLTRLANIAQDLVQHLPAGDAVGRARVLESWLRDSGTFAYSLQPVARDRELDPVEDFVMRHRVGHCEYFASALALMLRSVGIPARVAVGFKGGDYNSLGGFYQVRQRHAHTWVEAYLRPDQCPQNMRAFAAVREHGGWLLLDPTPGEAGPLEAPAGNWDRVLDTADYSRFLWSTYVMGLDASRQQQAIYDPLKKAARELWKGLFDPQWWSGVARRAWSWLQRGGAGGTNGWTWQGIVAVLLLLALGWRLGRVAIRGLRWVARRWWGETRRAERRRRASVEFYQRFEILLARHGLEPAAEHTPLEFATWAGLQLANSHGLDTPWQKLTQAVAWAYYQVRFGQYRLDSHQTATVEQALLTLQRALAEGGRPPAAGGIAR